MNQLKYGANVLRSRLSAKRPAKRTVETISAFLEEAEVIRNHIVSANVRLVIAIVLVTRQFWPQNGEAETALVNLGNFLHQADCEIHVLTARWETHWPVHFTFRNFEVTRLAHPSTKGW